MKRLISILAVVLISLGLIEHIRDYVVIRWTAKILERDVRTSLNERSKGKYTGIHSASVWVDISGQRAITRTNFAESTFDKWVNIDVPCDGCFFDITGAEIAHRGHGKYHNVMPLGFTSINLGAAVVMNSVQLGAVCRRENKVWGGGCRSIAAVAVGYTVLPIELRELIE